MTNYPGDQPVQAHLFVYKEQVIGGDISATVQNGFSHGLTPLTVGQNQTAPTSGGEKDGKTG